MRAHFIYSIVLFSLVNTFVFATPSQVNAGKAIMAIGSVKALMNEQERSLLRRAPVFLQDTVQTEIDSRTQLRMVDGGLLSLKEQTQLAIANYEFNPVSAQASIVLTLLKGGLRTVTGQLDRNGSDYHLNTPVASIGVRGTDYSAQLVEQDLLLAVWQGAIDVQVTVGANPMKFSLGSTHEYSVARVKANGEVEFLLTVPKAIAMGHTTELDPDAAPAADVIGVHQKAVEDSSYTYYVRESSDVSTEYDQLSDEWIDADFSYGDLALSNDGFSRTGTATFGLLMHNFVSTVGNVDNATMTMTVDFDQSRIPTGQLSFFDSQGEWFAVFNGVFSQTNLDININFATHGNELADGSISGVFVENGTQIFGDLSLSEINDATVNAGGTFLLGEQVQP
ncbi:FecR family protein [Thalassotalea fusca]